MASNPSGACRAVSDSAEVDAVMDKLRPHWKALRPCAAAQHVRAVLGSKIDQDDSLPDYVWQIADMAAQMAFNEALAPGVLTRPGGPYEIKATP